MIKLGYKKEIKPKNAKKDQDLKIVNFNFPEDSAWIEKK